MPPAETPAIDDAELEALFGRFAEAPLLLLAVSGGADSLALLNLAHRWRTARRDGPRLHVATVDHRLRPSSRREAEMVAGVAARLSLPATILSWTGPKPGTGIEAAARAARYELLGAAARRLGASHVLTAHHQDDQAETVLMRLGRGTGLAGLAGMRSERPLTDGVVLSRPLLGLPRSRLAATVAAAGLEPVDDASNRDVRFTRTRLRGLMPRLAAEGVTAAGLSRVAGRMARADAALDHYTSDLLARAVAVDAMAVATVDRARVADAPSEVRLRALGRLIQALAGAAYPPGSDGLEAMDGAVLSGADFRRTLGGVVATGRGGRLLLHREAGRSPPAELAVEPGFAGVFDHRFAIRLTAAPDGPMALGALGPQAHRAIDGIPRGRAAAIATLPALRIGGVVVAVPTLGLATHEGIRMEARCVVAERLLERPLLNPAL